MEKIKFLKGTVEMDYTRSPGKVTGKFLTELRDNQTIQGIRCGNCSHVFVPPQLYCPDCRIKMQSFVKLHNQGTIEYFTKVFEKMPFARWEAPYAFIAVRLAGAHTLLWHRMINIDNIKAGMKVKAVFKPRETREGSILDIDYFEAGE